MGKRTHLKQLTGPATNWLRWREARDRALAKPRRNAGAKKMRERAAQSKE